MSLLLTAAGVTAAHVAVLVTVGGSGPTGAPPRVASVHLRTVTPPERASTLQSPDGPAPVLAEPRSSVRATANTQERTPASAPSAGLAEATPSDNTSAQPTSTSLQPFDYVPRRYLTEAPKPRGAVVLDYPEGPTEPAPVVFVLALYIDESGFVRRARVDGGEPPPRFADAAERAFTGARFEPGRIGAEAVRSLVRVEVVYSPGTQ